MRQHDLSYRLFFAHRRILQDNLEIRRRQQAWLEENQEAFKAYNKHVAEHGVFSAGLRGF